ncbi:hypothetical protein FLAV_00893 [Flavobacteriales bacterium]|nr:hypothetical protein [Flavobacteriales bacterium]CAG0964665.1 hypothetical protein FLAV_00893 [Flavobacteriales bacterium]
MKYPWYESINKSSQILQGDFVLNCPIIIPPVTFEDEQDVSVKLLNAIIMSQSCDIENGKVDIILVCPYYNLEDFLPLHPTSKDGSKGSRKKVIDNLLHGNYPNCHILQKDIDLNIKDYLVVDFRNVYGIHYEFLKNHISKISNRNRLLPPYREHLSQAFARYFMRVGLPINIEI